MTVAMKIDLVGPRRRGLALGLNEAAGYGGRIIDPAMPVSERLETAAKVETFTDRRVERYWQLIGVLNDRPPLGRPWPFEWLIAALRG